MTNRLISLDELRHFARAGKARDVGVMRPAGDVLKFALDGPITGLASTEDIDLSYDKLFANGCQLPADGVVPLLVGHDPSELVGSAHLSIISKAVAAVLKLASDISPAAKAAEDMIRARFLRGLSVGFMVLDYSFTTDRSRPNGLDITRWRPIELSLTPIPCNQSALIKMASLGIDTRLAALWAAKQPGRQVIKSGRAISASNAALLETARGFHACGKKCIDMVLASDGDPQGQPETPPGHCGKSASEPCGLLESSACFVHGDSDFDAPPTPEVAAPEQQLSARGQRLARARAIARDARAASRPTTPEERIASARRLTGRDQ